ncbi:MAG: hypothetical protein ACLQVN_21035 [Bryobacteraceae bacterium]
MIRYRKARLRVAEFFFDERETAAEADIVRYQFRPAPIAGCRSHDFHSLCLDLGRDTDALLGGMHRETRYEIRRASREGLGHEFAARPEAGWMAAFYDFYDRFADSRQLLRVNRTRVEALARHGMLWLSRASAGDGRVLVWHAYLRSGARACLMHSASFYRLGDKGGAALVSRANRFHHWADIQRFREEGLAIYDFGGWYAGHEDTGKLRVNRFKESFGGEAVHEYSADRADTWKGAAALGARRLRQALAQRLGGRKS